jgi:chromosomal replication initiator protein
VNQDVFDIWPGIQTELRRAVGDSTYDIWLAAVEPVGLAGDTLSLSAPAEIRAWVLDRFGAVLEIVASRVLGAPCRVEVAAAGAGVPPPSRAEPPTATQTHDEHVAALNAKFTFGQFVIGDTNRFAHAAALAVAELPGHAYNPLFIYGPPGVGKTHLLHAIGNYVKTYGAGLTVRYTTVERFTNDFIMSIQGGSPAMGRFKGRYRHADVLLIDDVQFLQDKTKTEEEFFHTFNALREAGSQLVLTSDRPPRDLAALEDRLRERFEAGLVTNIGPPDLATRLTILRKRVQHDEIEIDDDKVLALIAERIPSNIRALEGGLIRVVAFASLTSQAVTCELAAEVLDGLYGSTPGPGSAPPPRPRVTVEAVQNAVCELFSITREELVSAERAMRVAWPRQIAMYLAREHTSETLPAIGRQFGGRAHTTVMHAVRRTTERLLVDSEASDTVHTLSGRLLLSAPDRRD